MQAFTQYTPTKIIFGKDTETQAGQLAKEHHASRVFVIYGGGSVVRSGLLDRVTASLKEEGLAYEVLGGVKPNPRLSFARQAVKMSIDFQADFVLAVGGGSVIDTAKAVAHGTANPDTDIWEFWSRKKTVEKSLPVGVVLTLAAAGSETSDSAVLTNEETQIKRGLSTDLNRPVFAVMNPELTYTLPKYQVGCGIVDIMMPNIDGYELTDVVRNSYSNMPILMVSAKQKTIDRKMGYLVGIDDYMSKPVDEEEFILKIKALLRRAKINDERKIRIGDVVLDYDSFTVSRKDEVVELPKKEFELLYKLLSYPGKIFTRIQLMDEIWGMDNESGWETVTVHIGRLRKKFENWDEFSIVSVRGLGYKGVRNDEK